ncbi:glycosyl transferase, family 8, nucleotide-diphospho-sugar transferase [Artemisia annua]|uniref:Glycosyl transferase, family 8, nucleotide-diphospho-sugar transferase n=1 Tax=Artemisia annua TaxID=35608 RepID=A0A2U1KTF1_ARTAN|nr:glycosyl transferase, family 8, nucleotide-diphospho-sugar transferase [Artemisia annua]
MVFAFLGGVSILVCFDVGIVSLGFGLSVVPRQVKPWTSLILMYELIFTILFLMFGCYFHMIYKWGKMVANQTRNPHPGASDYDSEKAIHVIKGYLVMSLHDTRVRMALLVVTTPLAPDIFGITTFFKPLDQSYKALKLEIHKDQGTYVPYVANQISNQ